jgi:hypothetical protein
VIVLLLVVETTRDLNLAPIALMLLAGNGFVFWGAHRLRHRREEWVIATGQVRLQVRNGHRVRPVFNGDSLQLVESTDSDGDTTHELVVLAGYELQNPFDRDKRKRQHTLAQGALGDATELGAFGRWLARRARIPFLDRTTSAAKAEDFETMKRTLAESGRLGSWLADRLPKKG